MRSAEMAVVNSVQRLRFVRQPRDEGIARIEPHRRRDQRKSVSVQWVGSGKPWQRVAAGVGGEQLGQVGVQRTALQAAGG